MKPSAFSGQLSAQKTAKHWKEIKMRDFKRIKVWQKSHKLALAIYKSSAKFPRSELYILISQIRRSCISIPSNIAEGCGRNGDAELARFLQIAMGSASELEYQLLLSYDLEFMTGTTHERLTNQVEEVKRMLTSFILRLRADR